MLIDGVEKFCQRLKKEFKICLTLQGNKSRNSACDRDVTGYFLGRRQSLGVCHYAFDFSHFNRLFIVC